MKLKERLKRISFIKLISIVLQEGKNKLSDKISSDKIRLPINRNEILHKLESQGYAVLENFYTVEQCQKIIGEIDRIIEEFDDKIWRDDLGSDERAFGAERKSNTINDFFENQLIKDILNKYEHSENMVGFILGARLSFKKMNLGSGQGWHRDAANKRQTKAILYLSDVNSESGPFQYLEGSHTTKNIISDTMVPNISFNQTRFTEDEIRRLSVKNNYQLKELTAKAGTLILADTRGIHRGAPITKGTRYALTKYTWYNMKMPTHMAKLLLPKN